MLPGLRYGSDALESLSIKMLHGLAPLPDPVPTGMEPIDRLVKGLHPGSVTVVGGRPSHGKTALSRYMAVQQAMLGHRVIYMSLEMDVNWMLVQILSSISGVPYYHVMELTRSGGQERMKAWYKDRYDEMRGKVQNASTTVGSMDLTLWKQPARGRANVKHVSKLLEQALETPTMSLEDDVRIVLYVDHAGWLLPSTRQGMEEDLYDLKHAAEESGACIVLNVQLNREGLLATGKGGKGAKISVPRMHHIRDSDVVEQIAHLGMLVHRPFKECPDEHHEREFKVYVEKNRSGSTGVVELDFFGPTQVFTAPNGGAVYGDE